MEWIMVGNKIRYLKYALLAAGILLLAIVVAIVAAPASASPAALPQQKPDNIACLFCHGKPGLELQLPSGENVSLTIDNAHFKTSAHSTLGCTDCHSDVTTFPHPVLKAQNARDLSLQMSTACQSCHQDQYTLTEDSVHAKQLAAGNKNAATCVDCHSPHSQPVITDENDVLLPEARLEIPQTCAHCHNAIYEQYQQSVHGAALTQDDNTDVPTCIDCHGVHNIGDPTTVSFRLNSPQLCAKCHTDPSIMDKYGISTQVLNTYVADFHGTTVTLFNKTSPDQATNKPVCFDCHGVHDIKPVDDPVNGIAMKQNLLLVCQRCHVDANANFPNAWMSHYIPSPTHFPIVYYVNIFYKIFIPTVIGGMLIFVISDIVRRLINRRKGARHA
jgi:hypothetical protein